MLGSEIALKHLAGQYVYNELLKEAARERAASEAVSAQPRSRGTALANVRTVVANALLRAGSWLMPEEPYAPAANRGLELRPGR
jgi:hypothetical protein